MSKFQLPDMSGFDETPVVAPAGDSVSTGGVMKLPPSKSLPLPKGTGPLFEEEVIEPKPTGEKQEYPPFDLSGLFPQGQEPVKGNAASLVEDIAEAVVAEPVEEDSPFSEDLARTARMLWAGEVSTAQGLIVGNLAKAVESVEESPFGAAASSPDPLVSKVVGPLMDKAWKK